MCPFNEQQLSSLLGKPLPEIEPEMFIQQTLDKANKRNLKRFVILQLFSLIALIPLLYFLPTGLIVEAINQFNIHKIASVQSAILSTTPLFIIAVVCYFIKDELT